MNARAAISADRQAKDVEHLGGPPTACPILHQNLRLGTVIKESHGMPIHAVAFNRTSARLGNLVATVGKDHATVYDDSHMGSFVAVVVQLINAATAHHTGGVRGRS